ncbi:N-acetylglucosamine kinase [Virgibacillus litoralis]|uniref:N-acetylglucosamine kinase-like BadF-type ATPase n=1 Tax=Virgibacillus litoralis TaxID=578221 RepID=A0ABS4HAV6_9BACI|nr:BadF/BadG/BcrA/BcrD ATPase family protein [Virgibacillus litoralis]MBP1948041.1 N-acetylglucosamine kinase-like BadF-type ATPase [Virgibacillus litoralis]
MEYVAGIDGGGTKTKAVIADMDGLIVAKTTAGPTNPNVMSREKLIQTLDTMMQDLKEQAPDVFDNISSVFAGISGVGNSKAKADLEYILKQKVSNSVTVCVEADTVNALYSGTYGEPGIVQISGTGSITYGINQQMKHDRVGGWGYLFGDEGSGYDIGRQGIMAALKANDGRGEKTILLEMLCTYFDVTHPYDFIQRIYASPIPKSEISPISKLVFEAYKQNDLVAKDIMGNIVNELSSSIRTLYMKLFKPDEEARVVLCGGVFSDTEVLPRLLKAELQEYKNITVLIPIMPPVGGSVIGSYLLQNIRPDSKIVQNIISTL